MTYEHTVERYLDALQNRDGTLARTLLTERGAVDDYRGRHYAGRDVIERFINQVGRRKFDFEWPSRWVPKPSATGQVAILPAGS